MVGRNQIWNLGSSSEVSFGGGFKPFSGENFHPETWGRISEHIFDERNHVSGGLGWGKTLPNCSLDAFIWIEMMIFYNLFSRILLDAFSTWTNFTNLEKETTQIFQSFSTCPLFMASLMGFGGIEFQETKGMGNQNQQPSPPNWCVLVACQ